MNSNLRFEITAKLKSKVNNVNLAELAIDNQVTILNPETGKINKGWIGQTLDKLIGVEIPNLSIPDGEDFELKSVKVVLKNNEWVPKETMAITMFNPEKIINEPDFYISSLWNKLQRLIIVGSYYESENPPVAYVKFIKPVDISDPTLESKLKDYWTQIKELTVSGSIADYSSKGTSQGFIQLRTKGSGNSQSTCPVTGEKFNTRAFYATKPFLKYVWGVMG